MTTSIFSQATGSLPFFSDTLQSSDRTQTQTSSGNETGSNMNVYTAGQQSAQDQVLGSLQGMLSGGNLGLTDAERQQAILDWNQNTAPILTAQLGSGTPALGSSLQQLILAMTAQGNARNIGATQNAQQMLGNLAYSPVGNTVNRTQGNTGNTSQTGSEHVLSTGFDTSAALNLLASVLGGQPLAQIGAPVQQTSIPTNLGGAIPPVAQSP